MNNNNVFLNAVKITKNFPGVKALDGVSLEIKEGEVHALVGENGAGKSTLTKIITGVYKIDSGEIFVDNNSVKINNVSDSLKLGISCIYQDPFFAMDLSVMENIFLGDLPRNRFGIVSWKEAYKKTNELFQLFNIDLNPRTNLRDVSVSKRQILEIVKSFSIKAKLIIMDEPTASLTSKDIQKLFEIIKRLKNEGLSVLYISHRMEEIFEIADRVTIFRDGKSVGTLDIKGTSHDEVISLMVGKSLKNLYPKIEAKISEEILSIKDFNKIGVFKDISFSVKKGEIVGIVGLVGSGRSELANSIFGVEKIYSGEVYVGKQKIVIKNPADAIKQGVCLIPEDKKSQGLFLDHSVNENINIASLDKVSKFGFLSARAGKKRSREFVNLLSIQTPSIEQSVKYLSGGNQQKVVIGKWIATEPKVLVLNEPTKGVDVGAKTEVYKIVGELAEKGAGILIFSPEILEVCGVCDKIIIIFKGKIVAQLQRGITEWDENIEKKVLNYCISGNSQ
ncbi:MAG: sugar ABC transporter ATP-binding protein [Candidatus Humimicrobiaceae bacterium]